MVDLYIGIGLVVLLTLVIICTFLSRIALALEDIAKAMRLEMDYHRIAKEPSQGLVNNLTLEEVSKEYEEISK